MWRWRNVPAPEPHLVGLAIGIVMQLAIPVKLLPIEWLGRANTPWSLLLFPAVLLWNHVQVMHEERSLLRQFGAEYRGYISKTRRYL